MMMKHSAVGQRERTTVVAKSHIDKIYTDGFKDGVRKMQERLKGMALGEYPYDGTLDVFAVDKIAKQLLEEDT